MSKEMEKYINKIIKGNCIKEMEKMPDECVDLIFADPPYGCIRNDHLYSDHWVQRL